MGRSAPSDGQESRQTAKGLHLCLLNHRQQHSDYDWMNIEYDNTRVGKIRGRINAKAITIYSIIIFSEFERQGYARKTIEMLKTKFEAIIADRVRPTAVGFWLKLGFFSEKNGTYVYVQNNVRQAPCLILKNDIEIGRR